MNRRNFLKAVGVGVGYLALPSIALPKTTGVINHRRLTEAMEKLFICKEGNESAFIEWDRMGAFQFLTSNAFHTVAKPEYEVIRLTYQTFAYGVEGGTEDDAQARLSQYFYKEFKEIAKGPEKKMLIWRLKPKFSAEEIVTYDRVWMTAEEKEDRTDAYEIPDGVEYDWMTGNLSYVKDKTMLYKLRMRLVIPETMFETEHPLAKKEGETIPRMVA